VVIERRIEQLLEKLLDNAVDFSDDEPVRLAMEWGDGAARIRVENSGSQLPEGPAAEQIFTPMHSGRKRTAQRHLGLGLYVARVIAQQHGGDIRAWNASESRVAFEARGAACR
jgi:signal transduction histidine kinase